MKLRFCNCQHCKRAHDSKRGQYTIKHAKRNGRRIVKQMIHIGDYDRIPDKISVPYLG